MFEKKALYVTGDNITVHNRILTGYDFIMDSQKRQNPNLFSILRFYYIADLLPFSCSGFLPFLTFWLENVSRVFTGLHPGHAPLNRMMRQPFCVFCMSFAANKLLCIYRKFEALPPNPLKSNKEDELEKPQTSNNPTCQVIQFSPVELRIIYSVDAALTIDAKIQTVSIMTIPTEPIGSIPRPPSLIEAIATRDGTDPALEPLYEEAIRDTIERFEATGSPVITDGEQRKYHNFWTYSVHGLPNTAPDGFKIPFAAGHIRRMPRLTGGPFRYKRYADSYLDLALRYAHMPVKQAVISPSALSLMYPPDEIPGYSREQFIDDLLNEHETEVRACLRKGAHKVQIDFTEGRFAVKVDPSGELLNSFIDLNNLALSRFSAEDRKRIGVHTCPGGDLGSTHSADVDYAELLPSLFELMAGNFYIALAGEKDRVRVLKIIRNYMKADQRVFVGVIAPIDPHVETPEEVRERVLEAAQYIPIGQLGTTDDCGFSPFCDDTSTTRDTAFEKIQARVQGTALAAKILGDD
jgi:5-methyltetrahydropteroyltriglutamate--homocysteine methyltransferase